MSFYQNGILISGVNTLPELTRAQYEALPADKRPEYWVCLDEEYEPSSSGHTIENNDGTDMPQEDNLQFVGVYTEDDATNGKTKVNIVRPMTKEQYEALTPAQKKGFIRTTDEPDNPIMVEDEETIEISLPVDSKASSVGQLLFYRKGKRASILINGLAINTFGNNQYIFSIPYASKYPVLEPAGTLGNNTNGVVFVSGTEVYVSNGSANIQNNTIYVSVNIDLA